SRRGCPDSTRSPPILRLHPFTRHSRIPLQRHPARPGPESFLLEVTMKNIAMTAVVCGMVAVSAAVPGAQERHRPEPRHFAGLLNDHTPSAAVVAKGPYEMRGKWSLDVDEARGTATFTAAMDMQTSD